MAGELSFAAHVEQQFARRDEQPEVRDVAILRSRDRQAVAEAAAWDAVAEAGIPRPPLLGLTIAVKACFDVEGWPTDAASKVLAARPAADGDAAIVAAIRREGAVVTSHTNMTEFAFGALGTNPHFGTPATPLDPERARIAGGSTSGGAVAVAAGFADAALGSDTSGSVRIPAAFCGLVGFKPSAHRYPTSGLVFLSPSFDVPGLISKDVATCRRIDRALTRETGKGPSDMHGCRFLVPSNFYEDDVGEHVAASFDLALRALREAGATIIMQDIPSLASYGEIAVEGGIIIAEAFAYHRDMLEKDAALYDPRVGPRIALGSKVEASRYIKAKERLAASSAAFQSRLDDVDALLMPTVPFIPPRLADLKADEAYYALNRKSFRLTEVANRVDSPSISIPIARANPVGLMLTSRRGSDASLLHLAALVEPLVSTLQINKEWLSA